MPAKLRHFSCMVQVGLNLGCVRCISGETLPCLGFLVLRRFHLRGTDNENLLFNLQISLIKKYIFYLLVLERQDVRLVAAGNSVKR